MPTAKDVAMWVARRKLPPEYDEVRGIACRRCWHITGGYRCPVCGCEGHDDLVPPGPYTDLDVV